MRTSKQTLSSQSCGGVGAVSKAGTKLNGKLIAPALFLALFASTPGLAGNYASSGAFQDTARVIASTPVYENINQPRRECWEEEVRYEERRYEPRASRRSSDSNVGSAIFGGLVGGVLGNSVGKGDGRKAATAIGAALGAMAGDSYADNRRGYVSSEPRVQVEQRCREVDNWSRKLTGYDVTYRYQGHEYTTFMPFDPGNKVRINVSVSLAEQ